MQLLRDQEEPGQRGNTILNGNPVFYSPYLPCFLHWLTASPGPQPLSSYPPLVNTSLCTLCQETRTKRQTTAQEVGGGRLSKTLSVAAISIDMFSCRMFKASDKLRVNILFSGDISDGLEGFDLGHALAQDCTDGCKATRSVLKQELQMQSCS